MLKTDRQPGGRAHFANWQIRAARYDRDRAELTLPTYVVHECPRGQRFS